MYSYLHHEQQRVEHDQSHDEIFKGRRDDHSPDFVFEAFAILGHVAFQRFGLDGEIDAGFLCADQQDASEADVDAVPSATLMTHTRKPNETKQSSKRCKRT